MKRDCPEELRRSGAVGRISLITLLSRVLGLLREQMKAFFLGTAPAADAFSVGFMIPNLLRRFLAEGVMAACVVPVFTEFLARRTRREVLRFLSVLIGTLCAVLGVVAALGVLGAPFYIPLFFGAFSPGKQALAVSLTSLMFPYIAFVSLASLFQGVANCHGRFSLPACAPVLFNTVVIGGTYLAAPRGTEAGVQEEAARIMALFVLAGGAGQALLLVPELLRLGYRVLPRISFRHEGVRRAAGLLGPVVLGAGVYQINTIVAVVLAARVPYEGAVAALTYSNRLLELALGVFVVSVATVALPDLSRLWASEQQERFLQSAALAMKLALLVGIPAGFGLLALRSRIIRVLFGFGAFDQTSVALTEQALKYHALGVPLIAWCRIFAQGFYAQQDTKTPLRAGALVALFNIAACFVLVGPMGHGGIALAMTLSTGAGAVWYWWQWVRRHGRRGLPGVFPFAARCVAASLAMVLFDAALRQWVVPDCEGAGKPAAAAALLGSVIVDGCCFFCALRLLGERGLGLLIRTVLRRTI